jgi:hypothetical protein
LAPHFSKANSKISLFGFKLPEPSEVITSLKKDINP